eukprot:364640-Chlamydomonas_euryale.AAC.16
MLLILLLLCCCCCDVVDVVAAAAAAAAVVVVGEGVGGVGIGGVLHTPPAEHTQVRPHAHRIARSGLLCDGALHAT